MPPIPTPTPPLPVTPAPTIPATLPPAAAPAPDAFKPVHSPTPTPVKPVLAPPLAPPAENRRTVAEVDLHEAKAGETYSAIAKEHYGDAKYAQALQAHNKSRAIKAGDSVEVPTLAVIRRRSRGAAPAGGATSTSESSPTWSAAPVGRTAPVVAAPSVSVSKTYAVKRDGVSLWDVSEDVYGDRKHSRQIAEANPDLKDRNGKFQRGDELRLPAE